MVEALKRIFVGVPLPIEVRVALEERLAAFRLPGKPTPPQNWHFTLRFLGQTDRVTLDRLVSGLDQADLGTRFRMVLEGLGAFPNGKKATVLWAQVVTGGDRLSDLAAVVEEAVQSAGLAPDDRPYRPHLTLSRIRPQEDIRHFVAATAFGSLEWQCRELVVYESHLGGAAPRYEHLESFPLTR